MTSYLRAYVESVTDVPQELRRHFCGIRDLDLRVAALQQQLDEDTKDHLKEAAEKYAHASSLPSKRQKVAMAAMGTEVTESELGQKIERNIIEIVRLSEEKMNRAQQVYDYIDQHIRKLDKDLRSFDAEVAKERQRLGLPPAAETSIVPSVTGPVTEGTRKKRGRSTTVGDGDSAAALTSEEMYQQALAVADPTEPKYCYCNRISFGEMIACEHPDCPIEWFHFECVGLNSENRPKGKWYCKECRKLLQK